MDSNHLRTVLETGRLPLTTSPCILLLSNPQCDNLSKESLEGNFRFADRNCFIGPEDRTRTDTMLPSAVFETAVYANSTTTGYEVGRETGAYAVVPVSQRVSSCFAALLRYALTTIAANASFSEIKVEVQKTFGADEEGRTLIPCLEGRCVGRYTTPALNNWWERSGSNRHDVATSGF